MFATRKFTQESCDLWQQSTEAPPTNIRTIAGLESIETKVCTISSGKEFCATERE